MIELFLSKREICKTLNISECTLYRWIKDHGFPAHKIGFRWKFRLSEVEQWSKSRNMKEERLGDSILKDQAIS